MALVGNYSYLLSGEATLTGVGANATVADLRRAYNYYLTVYASTTPSAAIGFDASHDGTGWFRFSTVTATTTTATASISGFYYPYVRAVVHTAFGNGGGLTGTAVAFIAGGLQSTLG